MSGHPFINSEAWDIYRTCRNLPIIRFLPEANSLDTTFATLTTDPALPHRLWTDAYLAALAISTDNRLVSFDTNFQRFPGLNLLLLKP